jgi:hypothetical protein
VADAFDDGDEQDGHGGVHDARDQVAVCGGDVEVGDGGDEGPGGPPQDWPGRAEVFGEQVPGQRRQDAGVDADRYDPRPGAELRSGEMADGGE